MSWKQKSELLENNRRIRKNHHRKKPPARRFDREGLSFGAGAAAYRGYRREWSPLVPSEPGKQINIMQYVSHSLRITAHAIFALVLSLVFVFFHDIFTQSTYFEAQAIVIQGIRHLSEKEVLEQAHIRAGMNIFSVNLSEARTRLAAHPWVEDAELRRSLPSEIHIKIAEHSPLAVLDLLPDPDPKPRADGDGQRFIINTRGHIFKAWKASDPEDLPFVRGLGFADICMPEKPCGAAFSAVMDILRLGGRPGSIVPNRLIRAIEVDREMGITLKLIGSAQRKPDTGKPLLSERIGKINLGYDDYPGKYDRLEHFLFYLEENGMFEAIDSVDLNHLNRIVINPM